MTLCVCVCVLGGGTSMINSQTNISRQTAVTSLLPSAIETATLSREEKCVCVCVCVCVRDRERGGRGGEERLLLTCSAFDCMMTMIPYSGKFSHGAKFRVFRGWVGRRENKNRKS